MLLRFHMSVHFKADGTAELQCLRSVTHDQIPRLSFVLVPGFTELVHVFSTESSVSEFCMPSLLVDYTSVH